MRKNMYSYQEYHRHKDWLKLNTASKKGQLKAVKRWLDADIDPNTYDAEALTNAIEYNQVEVVKLFLESGKLTLDNKYEALHKSVMNYTHDIVDLFLADPEIDLGPNTKGRRILELAVIFNGNLELIEKLLAREDVDVNIDNGALITKVIGLNSWHEMNPTAIEILKLFLASDRIELNSYSHNPLQHACIKGNMTIFNLLYNDERVDPAADNNIAIQAAAQYGHTKIVKILMADERVDPADLKNRAFNMALQRNKFEAAVTLLDNDKVLKYAMNGYMHDKNLQTALMVYFDVDSFEELKQVIKMAK